ncbi:ABC transporter ATP-binding protein [Chelatococcus asaccharovorans]|uniref:Amino acid/amide ABC transporter ATP-binding protein 2 (HAAT family) n=1 Tax=Chelatococcus asaccharovorans TaxID=28210 RepID=A0A2V3U8S5_9HYPH|nr:ABC transporter ATP-binding protein [Chelatococcus asaccharovorans]MBS7705494.1 ABC transporter ATP-binding protein [Chelatococcus asaccharovorans]PXW60101.1 amino acid/amide ABC transporter ATP-binding protein 2 (HAAT family) [Chelatococcus asaccharovorans]CAH1655923.1 High-affinity branched-chain amino acid transport ATP-binding protein BraG [Chelatococcus asaccharovorans]CAH1685263.1 High-affinity branched-chain amino acid transport ATP-binding protein BraG [Chelatococcus asaccharovorans]
MLRVENLVAAYDGIKALRGVSIELGPGEFAAVIGANGAGKSTLLNTVSGLVRPVSGKVLLDGKMVAGLPAYQIARRGLLQVPEGRMIMGNLTVRENILLGSLTRNGRTPAHDLDGILDLFPRLRERMQQVAGTMSGGEQQMLAIARALMGAPKVLLLDEPSLGLSPLMADLVFTALSKLHASGLAILLIEQNVHRALEVAQRAYVMEQGRIVQEGSSRELINDARLIEHYLGGAVAAA